MKLKDFFSSCSTSSGKKVKSAKQKYSNLAPKQRPILVSKSQPNLEQWKLTSESNFVKGSDSRKSKSKFYDVCDGDPRLGNSGGVTGNGILGNIDNYDLSSIAHALEPLKVGDRVVWVRELPGTTSQESGTVRWIGVIENEEIAGIEFDRPLGLGSGWYRRKQLFSCPTDHGGLVAVAGLILEEDLEVDAGIYPPSLAGSSISPASSTSSSLTKPEKLIGGVGKRRFHENLTTEQVCDKHDVSVTRIYPKSESSSPSWSSGSSGADLPTSSHQSEYPVTKLRCSGFGEGSRNATQFNKWSGSGHIYENGHFDEISYDQLNSDRISPNLSPPNSRKLYSVTRIPESGAGEQRSRYRETDIDALQPVPPVHQTRKIVMPSIPYISPPLGEDDIEKISGRPKGIQGHCNSCYLDATLFAMFSFTSVFDSILLADASLKNGSLNDRGLAEDTQRILREEIVNPLRKDYLTPAANVMKLRETMYHLDDKLTSEEMDPQEFLQILFNNVLKLKEFISLSSGQSEFFHQVICHVTEDDREQIPTVQQLFEQSLRQQELKLKSIPSPALILQMPRYGNRYKTYKGILPNLTIDITDLIEDTPRECIICGLLATHECPDCNGQFAKSFGADSTAFCASCIERVHKHVERAHHRTSQPIKYSFPTDLYFLPNLSNPSPSNYTANNNFLNNNDSVVPNFLNSLQSNRRIYAQGSHRIPRVTMDLFAVICIETSHFVSFVKCGVDQFAPWVFFDSMADRCENAPGKGHNIPQVKMLPKMGTWLSHLEAQSQDGIREIMGNITPELKRLLTDPYICLYYSPQTAMHV